MAASRPMRMESIVDMIDANSEPNTAALADWLTPPTPYSRMASGSNKVRKLTKVGFAGNQIAGEAFQSVGGLRAVTTIQNTGNSVTSSASPSNKAKRGDRRLTGISGAPSKAARGSAEESC